VAAPRAATAAVGKLEGSKQVERVQGAGTGMPADGSGGPSAPGNAFSTNSDSTLRELCHDLIEPAATIKWLVRAAEGGSGEELHDRLAAIAAAAGQIAAICGDVLDPPRRRPCVRLDRVAAEAVASAQARYSGAIDIVSHPVIALACTGDIIRIFCNLLANACRAAGPVGRVVVAVGRADGWARLSIADSGHGLAGPAPGGRAGLGLDIVGMLAVKNGGTVALGVSDLGGLAVTVQVPAQGGYPN
jgi:signal transduction histidine kinase